MAVPSIVVANEYTSVHSKAWIVGKKERELPRDRVARGPVSVKMRDEKRKIVKRTFDNPDEMLKAMWQDSDAKLASYRYPDQESFKNRQKQTGKAIWSHLLVKQIIKLNSNLFVEDAVAVPGCAGFYKMVGQVKTFTGASFRKGLVPEFTIIKTDTADLPVEFTYGWRTVLLRLVKSRDLTMAQINRVWGEVKYGDERAKHWAMNVREFRI